MFQRSLLRDADVEPLAGGVFRVLETVGVLCQNDELLRALARAGARVDFHQRRARFPRAMQAQFVEQVRRESPAADDGGHRKFPGAALPRVGTQVAQFFHDDETRRRRAGNRADLITLIRLGDVLHGETGVGHALLLTDVPPLLEPLEAALLLAEHARRPGAAFAWNVRQIDYLIEMGHVLGIEDWFSWGATCFAHPLRFDR